jgi:Ca2+-binding RTX toxin-like protein
MTISRITLEWRPLNFGNNLAGHLALVARDSSQADGQGVVISGNPSLYGSENSVTGEYGYLQTNLGNGAGSALSVSVDAYGSGVTESARHAVDITSVLLAAGNGSTLSQIWNALCALAEQINASEYVYDPASGAPPVGATANSNSLIATVLSSMGIDIAPYLAAEPNPPTVGWPGSDSILVPAGDSYMRGWGNDDTFLVYGGGNHIIHGGDGDNLVRTDFTDGSDVARFDGFDSLAINTSEDLNSWIATIGANSQTYVTTMYSIELFGAREFGSGRTISLQNQAAPVTLTDKVAADIETLEGQLGGDVESFLEIATSTASVQVFNFQSFTGTTFTDQFSLNKVSGRAFDGGDDTGNTHVQDNVDTVSYSGLTSEVTTGISVYYQSTDGTASVNRTGVVTEDTFASIEHMIGTAYMDYFEGANGDSSLASDGFTPDGGGGLTLDGGAALDTYAFNLTGPGGAGKDYGHVTIADTDEGVIHVNSAYYPLQISKMMATTDHLILSVQAGSGLLLGLDRASVGYGGISTISFDGTVFDAKRVIDFFLNYNSVALTTAGLSAQIGRQLAGTMGNDVHTVQYSADQIIEAPGGGTDLANAIASYVLPDNVENLTLTGTGNINGTGNSADNTITGNSGNNTLAGGGGVDKLIGGTGNDTYIIDSDDVVSEAAAGGSDTIQADFVVNLSSYANVENLILTGTSSLNLTGSSGANTLTGNSGNNTLDGGAAADVMIGGDGDDVYIVDATTDVVSENASEGIDSVRASATVILGANIENLTLTGSAALNGTGNALANYIIGNIYRNTLSGLDGNDTLDGGGYLDTLIGGTGDDVYFVTGGETLSEASGAGEDSVFASGTFTLAANIENLSLTGSSNIDGTGNASVNILTGNSGNNHLNGSSGADTMIGGTGNDSYSVDSVSDVIVENANEGTDTVVTSISWTLAENFENLSLVNGGSITGTGNDYNNTISGSGYANTLDGGAGSDTLIGGLGDDVYVVDETGDVVSEEASQGTDTVRASVSFTLAANVEKLVLTGSSGLDGTGNSLNNTITGNSGNNTLDAGSGTDTLIGGLGDDVYVSDGGDVIIEASGEGFDILISTGSVNLSSYANIESVTLSGTANNYVLGSSTAEILVGNSGNNSLIGNGGMDTMIGGAGNDVYGVDDAGDVVSENASEGTDTVRSSISYTLAANLENLELTGSGTIDGTGNSGNNTLTGNSAVNTLTGGAGDDLYILNNAGAVLVENAAEGSDSVQVGATYTLAANFENLTLTGSSAINGTGNSLDNVIVGNSGVNILSGGDGDDTLDGGAGADTLSGGNGNDLYIVDNTGDVILNASDTSGTDSVQSSVTYSLSTLGNIDNLTLTGSSAVNATGNTLDNILRGDLNSAVNTLTGGAGNDSYYVGTGDVVVEAASAGTDTVNSTGSWTLATNVENLTLLGTGDIDGTGNTVVNTITGNSGNNTLSGGTGADTLIGGAGDDVFLVDNAGDVVSENASEGVDSIQSTVVFSLAGLTNIENLALTAAVNGSVTGNDLDNTLTATSGANTLTGAGGNDYLDGGAGADTMIGGTGDDTFVISVSTDILSENAGEGTDLVISVVTHTLAANFENLTLDGATAINGTGNASVNILTGNTGINSLNGMAGADTLIGGAGNDIYFVDDAGDVVIELSAEGTDSVQSAISYTLTDNVENLTLTGSSNLNASGNSTVNTLTGNTGNNTLDGGAGADDLNGGTGNDTYLVDNAGDTVTEAASAGTDLVLSSVSFTLGANLENLTLTGSGDINATGNTVANTLTGNSGNNTLTGGTGADTLIGGAGDDTYFVDNASDVVSENSAEGTDTVSSTVTFSLASLSNIEHLTLTGTTVINATGNDLDNILTGNAVKNILSGGGGNDTIIAGGGADTMLGGTGDDLYIVSVTTSVISEGAGEGTDSVQSSVTYTLSAEVENLTLTAATAINGTGNASANLLIGGTGNNALSGGAGNDTLDGGTGLDTLTGGADADIFEFGNVSNIDVVTDFSTAQGDALDLRDLLTGYDPGSHTITDWVRITDVSANSKVEVDRDGTGGTYGWVQIATLNGVTGLTDEAALVANGNLLAA